MDFSIETPSSHRPKSLLDLPQTIRLEIYSHAVEPFVDFMLARREHFMTTRPERREHTGTAGFCLPSRRRQDSDEQDDSWDSESSEFEEGPVYLPTLAFRVSTFSPLLLVSKQVSSEVSHWIHSSGFQSSIHATIRRCVFGDTLDPSQDPGFVQLFKNSRLILSFTAKESISFLKRIPTEIRGHIESVVFTLHATKFDDYPTGLAWSKKKTERHSDYVEALQKSLPNLREIAMQMPLTGADDDYFCTTARNEVADLLFDGIIDTLRLVYKEAYGARLLDGDTHLESIQAYQCLACGKKQSWMEQGVLKRCKRCLKALYCSPACQKADWSSHRAWCKEADEAERRKAQPDPRLPRFDAVLEEHIDGDSGKVLFQTAPTPRNRWLNYKSVLALTRRHVS